MAKTSYVIKRLSRYGKVERSQYSGIYYCEFNEMLISFTDQGGEAICISSRRVGQEDDPMSDYFAGSYHDNITRAIQWALSEATLANREPCPDCVKTIGRKRWVEGRTEWTCYHCGAPTSGKHQEPESTPAARMGTQINQPGLLPIGSKVYYTGDQANADGQGWVGSHMAANPYRSASLNIELEDGRVFAGVFPANLRWPHEENRGQRFVIRQPAQPDGPQEALQAPAGRPALHLRLVAVN